jgi:hypothetical protein
LIDSEMKMRKCFYVAALAVWVSPASGQGCPAVAGWVERAAIASPPRTIEAKLDTGAETSAIGASGIELFERDGVEWVRFTPQTTAGSPIETPLVRWTKVRRAGTKTDRRPVVSLALCLGGQSIPAQFTLTDRSGLDYPVLIGREALSGRIAVDSSRTYIAGTPCPP